MNQCKRLSDCPAERLAQCRGDTAPPAGYVDPHRAQQGGEPAPHVVTVPPAGDVEVLKVQYRVTAGPMTGWSFWNDGNGDQYREYYQVQVRELVDRAHVTRLTAERDGLLANVKELTEHRDELKMQRDRWVRMHGNLQSELTTARESGPINWTDRQVLDFLGVALRNVDLVGEVRLSEIRQGFEYIQERQAKPVATPTAQNADYSCGQDAEAAKLEPAVDCGDCPIITDGCRGTCMKADRNTEWEDTFGPDYTGEDAEAACVTPAGKACPGDGVSECKSCPDAEAAKGDAAVCFRPEDSPYWQVKP